MRRFLRFWLTALAATAWLTSAPTAVRAAMPADELKAGDPAPDFTLPGTDGKTYTLSQLKGKTVVLAWFPMAFTGG